MVNCADCNFSYVDDLFGEWCCMWNHSIHIDPETNYPIDIKCKHYKEDSNVKN